MTNLTRTYAIEGMNCSSCQSHVNTALTNLDNIESAEVNLESKQATVLFKDKVDHKAVLEAVSNAGYKASEMEETSNE